MSGPLQAAVGLYEDWRRRSPTEPSLPTRIVLRQGEQLFFNGISLAAVEGAEAASEDGVRIVMVADEDAGLPMVVLAESDVVLVEFQPSTAEPEPIGFVPGS